jgi:hypothetical protein
VTAVVVSNITRSACGERFAVGAREGGGTPHPARQRGERLQPMAVFCLLSVSLYEIKSVTLTHLNLQLSSKCLISK